MSTLVTGRNGTTQSKLLWAAESHSEMQLQDVRNLIRSVADFDWTYIERWADELTIGELLREVRG